MSGSERALPTYTVGEELNMCEIREAIFETYRVL